MKQFTLIFPKSRAEAFATLVFQLEIRVILSWLESKSDWFQISAPVDELTTICAMDETKLDDFRKTDFYKFVKQ